MKRSVLHRVMLAVTALCMVLSLMGCGAALQAVRQLRKETPPGVQTGETGSKPAEPQAPAQPDPEAEQPAPQGISAVTGQNSYISICSFLQEHRLTAGVAFLGYVDNPMKEEEYRDLLERRGYLESYDFLAAMPEDHLIRTANGHQLYCLVPAKGVTVTVSEWMGSDIYGDDSGQAGELLYQSDSGDPILLLCGYDLIQPDLQVCLEDAAGNLLTWLPRSTHDSMQPYLAEQLLGSIVDFTPATGIDTEGYLSELATPEVLQGEWVAWNAHTTTGEPLVCRLRFYRDEAGNDCMEYGYAPPMGETYAWFAGSFTPSAQPSGWVTEDMSEFSMELVGGAALETGLPPQYEGGDPSFYLSGAYSIDYYPELDVIEVGHQFGSPLLDGIITIPFERVPG
ncbi:MAG: hypothetical protein MR014_05940 [Oscillospiraceae bacterium]|nr:hypothetical protein [Oscillospiraceae bacterium]